MVGLGGGTISVGPHVSFNYYNLTGGSEIIPPGFDVSKYHTESQQHPASQQGFGMRIANGSPAIRVSLFSDPGFWGTSEALNSMRFECPGSPLM